MDPFCLLESWLIREAGFWILTRRKERDFGGPLPHHAMDLGPHSITTSLSSPSACSMGPTVVRYGMSPESVTPAATPTVCLLALLLQDIREHFSVLRTPRKRLSYVATREDFGRMIFQKNSSWVSYLFKVMSDGIGKTRRRQL